MPLFIGGPLDGRLVEVDPSRNFVEVAVNHEFVSDKPLEKPNKLTDIFYYKREVLDCPSYQVAVYVPRSYTCQDLLTSLIQGYHQNALSPNQ